MSDMCDEQVIHDNNYTNTYSLWGNSKYYDIKNLSPQNFANRNGTIGSEISQEFKASRWSSSPSEGQAPEPPDYRNRRTVERESLYEDPDTFHKEINEESPSKSPTFDWTQFYWHKATEKAQEGMQDAGQGPSGRNRKQQVVGANKIQKKLDKMLAKPVKMTKAESQLCIYKEAPPHVFLIIPDDLKDEAERDKTPETENGEEILTVEVVEEPAKVAEELEPEEETNPFLISITRNLKKKSDSECQDAEEIPEIPEEPAPALPEMSKIMTRIVDYFKEFVEDKKFSQLKFLGPFTEEEIGSINEFIEQAVKFLSKEDECPLACIFEKVAFEINEDCTGNTVIYKRPV